MAGFQIVEDMVGTIDDGGRDAGKLSHMDTETMLRTTANEFTKEDDLTVYLTHRDIEVTDTVQRGLHLIELVIVRSKKGLSVRRMVMDVLDNSPSDRDTVISGGAASQLIKEDETALTEVIKDSRGFVHLHHKSGLALRDVIRSTDAREDLIHYANRCTIRRHKRANLREKDDGDTMLTRDADLLFTFGPDRAEKNPDAESGYPVRMTAHYAEEESASHRLLHTASANVESRLMLVNLNEFYENSAAGTFVTVAYEETEYDGEVLPAVRVICDQAQKGGKIEQNYSTQDGIESFFLFATPTDRFAVATQTDTYAVINGDVCPVYPYTNNSVSVNLYGTPTDDGNCLCLTVEQKKYIGRIDGTCTDWQLTEYFPFSLTLDSKDLVIDTFIFPRCYYFAYTDSDSGMSDSIISGLVTGNLLPNTVILGNAADCWNEVQKLHIILGVDGEWLKPADWRQVRAGFSAFEERYRKNELLFEAEVFSCDLTWNAGTDNSPMRTTFSLLLDTNSTFTTTYSSRGLYSAPVLYYVLTEERYWLDSTSYYENWHVFEDGNRKKSCLTSFLKICATLTDYNDLSLSYAVFERTTAKKDGKISLRFEDGRLMAEREFFHLTFAGDDHGFVLQGHDFIHSLAQQDLDDNPFSMGYYMGSDIDNADIALMKEYFTMLNEGKIVGNDYLLDVSWNEGLVSVNLAFEMPMDIGLIPADPADAALNMLQVDFLFTAAYDDDGVVLTLSHHCPELIMRISHNADTETRWGRLMSRLDAERGEICSVSFRKATETDGRVTYTANLHMNETGGDYDLTGQIWRDGDVYGLYANKMEDGVDMLLFAGDVLLSKDAFRLGNLHLTAVDSDTLGYHNVFDEFGVKYDLSWDRFGGAEAFKLKLVYDEISSEPILISFGVEDGAFHISAEAHLNSEMIPNAPDVVKIGFTFDTEAEEEMTTVEAVFDGMSREDFPPMAEETDDEDD